MLIVHIARKPLSEGSVSQNVLKHGTGALHIDAARVASPGETIENHSRGSGSAVSKGIYGDSSAQETHQTAGQRLGRHPANLVLEHKPECRCVEPESCVEGCPVSELDRHADEGGASRFFKQVQRSGLYSC